MGVGNDSVHGDLRNLAIECNKGRRSTKTGTISLRRLINCGSLRPNRLGEEGIDSLQRRRSTDDSVI
jgi:hypothetical protein